METGVRHIDNGILVTGLFYVIYDTIFYENYRYVKILFNGLNRNNLRNWKRAVCLNPFLSHSSYDIKPWWSVTIDRFETKRKKYFIWQHMIVINAIITLDMLFPATETCFIRRG